MALPNLKHHHKMVAKKAFLVSRFGALLQSQKRPLPTWMCRRTAGRPPLLGKKKRPTLVEYIGAAEDEFRRWYARKNGAQAALYSSQVFF